MNTWIVSRDADGNVTVIFDDGAFAIPNDSCTLNTGNNANPKGATP